MLVPLIGIMFGNVVMGVTGFLAHRFDMTQAMASWSVGHFSMVMQGRYELVWLAVPSAGVSASTTVLLAAARRRRIVMMLLAVCAVTACLLYQFVFVNPRFFDYAMSLRLPRLAGIVTAAVAVAGASLVFQTVIRNNIVTPCLLGMNSLYALIHTVVAFVFGATSAVATDPVSQFAVDLALMGVMGLLIYGVLFEKTGGNVPHSCMRRTAFLWARRPALTVSQFWPSDVTPPMPVTTTLRIRSCLR